MPPLEPPDLAVPIKPRGYFRRHGHRDRVGYSLPQPLLPKETVMPDHPQNAPVQPGQGPPQQQQQGQQPQPGQPQPQGQQSQGGQPPQPAPQSSPPAGGDGGAAVLDLDHHAEAVAAAIRQQSQAGPPPAGAGADPGRLQQILGQIGQYGPFVLQFLESLVTKLQGGSQQPTP